MLSHGFVLLCSCSSHIVGVASRPSMNQACVVYPEEPCRARSRRRSPRDRVSSIQVSGQAWSPF